MRHDFDLEVEVIPARDRVIVALTGELDLHCLERVREAIDELWALGFPSVVLDLRGLTFMDSKGIAFLVSQDSRAREQGRSFSIAYDDGPIARLLALTGLDGHFDVAAQGRPRRYDQIVTDNWIRDL